MKKVLFIATVQSHILNFHLPYIEYFQKRGFKVYVATKLDKEGFNNIDNKNIIWENIDFSRNPFSIKTLVALIELIKLMSEYKFDLIHLHTPIAAFLGRLASKITNTTPVIYTAHGFHFYKKAPSINWLIYYTIEKIAARWTDCLITINNEDYVLAKNKLDIKNKDFIFKVNGVGVDIDKYNLNEYMDISFKKSMGFNEDDFVISIIAELNKNKNQIQIINAMEHLAYQYKDIKVLLVGDGNLKEKINCIIENKNLKDNVIMLGHRDDVSKILNISDVVGLFSKREGLPKSLMEAMAAKKAIIATDIRGNNDLVINGNNGLLIPYNDIESTINAIKKLYNNRSLVYKMGENSRRIIDSYSLKNVLNEMGNIYSYFI